MCHQLNDVHRRIRNIVDTQLSSWTLQEAKAVLGTFAAIDRIRHARNAIGIEGRRLEVTCEPPGDLGEQRIV